MLLREILRRLRDTYTRTIGIEYMHIQDPTQRLWVQAEVEAPYQKPSPDEQKQILDALIRARNRGVDVRLMFPMASNHVLADWASRGFYTQLLREEITVLLYKDAMIHAKTATIDGVWSTIGTANIDRLSLRRNFEINMEIFGTEFATAMERIFKVDQANSHELTLSMWNERSTAVRVIERVLRPLAPLM